MSGALFDRINPTRIESMLVNTQEENRKLKERVDGLMEIVSELKKNQDVFKALSQITTNRIGQQ